MSQIVELIENIKRITYIQIMDIIVAICIIILFRIFSSSIAYIIIRMFKLKVENKKKIKESAFYNPLKVFFDLLGIYIAVIFLKKPLNISNEIMGFITKAFEIISIIAFARGLAKSFTPKSTLVKKMKAKRNNIDDSMFEFILKIVRFSIYIIAGLIIITLLGVNLNTLVAGLGIGGVILTLAAQDTAKNLFGGFVIFIDRPFAVGDWIEMS